MLNLEISIHIFEYREVLMKLFEKIKIKLKQGKIRQLRMFGVPILEYGIDKNGKYWAKCFFFQKQKKKNISKDVFYLKVNRHIKDTFINLQYWVDVVYDMGADFYILCDNPDLKTDILRTIVFKDENIKFIKSHKRTFKDIVKSQKIDKKWLNASYAHLTTFLHAKKHNITTFWNIDADDALFLISPSKAVEILKNAKTYAEKQKIDLFGFDFWVTKTEGRHWSFGITYTRMEKDYFNYLRKYIIDWDDYRLYTSVHNLDWVFTSLRDKGVIKTNTFYVENLYFIHWGRFFGDMRNSYIATWNKTSMIWLLWENILGDKRGIFPLVIDKNKLVKLDFLVLEEESQRFGTLYLLDTKR